MPRTPRENISRGLSQLTSYASMHNRPSPLDIMRAADIHMQSHLSTRYLSPDCSDSELLEGRGESLAAASPTVS
jgi:hypothetical protein